MVVINTRTILLYGLLYSFLTTINGCNTNSMNSDGLLKLSSIERQLKEFVDEALNKDSYKIIEGVSIEVDDDAKKLSKKDETCEDGRGMISSFDEYVTKKYEEYMKSHVVSIKVPQTARFFNFATGKSSFLTGFGLGFMAFGLKKLLLPIMIGGQILKSVLIAMFLPSILGSIGKLVGKGLSQASSVSGSSGHPQPPIEDFDFKDTGTPYNADATQDNYPAVAVANPDFNFPAATTTDTANKEAMNRYGNDGYYQRVQYVQPQSESYYLRRPLKQHDYKVFHKIPSSSMLLTTYDPFYSPLLSRLDSVFQQLGMDDGKGPQIEKCRERLVCLMYANPAKYAPYSNLVSAQLSRELNELRKPSSDNPEILRFFRYMKAAKDGQDGEQCLAHSGCPSLQADKPSPAMLTTFNDINKLVQARKMQ